MKPKFSWDSATAGSLILTVKTDTRMVSWDIRKSTPADKLRKIFGELMLELTDADFDAIQGAYDREDYTEWAETYMNETVRTVDQEELDALREAASLKALSDKAASVTLTGGNFWGNDDLSSLDLYELGTGEPE